MKRNMCLCLLFALCLGIFTGCGTAGSGDSASEERGKDWDYTVVLTEDIPEALKKEIDAKKLNAFQMTYEEGEYLYLAVGYGEQENSGFSIRVSGLYEKGDGLCLETSLCGPGEDEIVSSRISYPTIVIKTEKSDWLADDKKIRFIV